MECLDNDPRPLVIFFFQKIAQHLFELAYNVRKMGEFRFHGNGMPRVLDVREQ
jgi:hypothetical protein